MYEVFNLCRCNIKIIITQRDELKMMHIAVIFSNSICRINYLHVICYQYPEHTLKMILLETVKNTLEGREMTQLAKCLPQKPDNSS